MKKSDRFIKLWSEFNDYLKEIQGYYLDSRLGFSLIQGLVKTDGVELKNVLGKESGFFEEIQGYLTFKHEEYAKAYIPGAGESIQRFKNVIKRNKKNGLNQEILAQLLIVNLAAYWEMHFREKVSKAYGCKEHNQYKNDIWGYLIALRNCILHNQGKVNITLMQRAKRVGKLLNANSKIEFNDDFVHDVFMKVYGFLGKLHSESLSKSFRKVKILKEIIDQTRSSGFRKRKYKNET